jgi:hypothetical protein
MLSCLIYHIECIEQPFDGIDEVYKQNLRLVLEFFVSKLPLYYSSSRLTLLITLLDIPPELHSLDWHPLNYENRIDIAVPLPSRLKTVDYDALGLLNVFIPPSPQHWDIFQDFLNSGHPQALNREQHATAALVCLKIIFKHYQALLSPFLWLGQHSRTLRVDMKQHSDLPEWTHCKRKIQFYWYLRIYISIQRPQKMPRTPSWQFQGLLRNDSVRSSYLQFLLKKSAHSNHIINFARHRVFRFGYLNRKHPIPMKKAIFALAKYIQRVTGETAEVRTCEAIWGRQRWFTEN